MNRHSLGNDIYSVRIIVGYRSVFYLCIVLLPA
jgi:hypothetical protein